MRRISAAAVATVLAVVAGAFWLATGASGASLPTTLVQCGDEITESIRVGNSLTGCDDGLKIVADGVTLDLGSHVLEGTGDNVEKGISAENRSDVLIMNGTVRGFTTGVSLNGADGVRIARVNVFNNTALGLNLTQANDAKVVNVNAENNGGQGISLDNTTNSIVRRSRAASNDANGIIVHNGSTGNLIEDNTVTSNEGSGISATSGTNTIRRNRSFGNHSNGIVVLNAGGTVSFNSTKHNSADGIQVFNSEGTLVVRNRAIGNASDGIFLENAGSSAVRRNLSNDNGSDGIETVGAADIPVVRNVARNNGFAGGIDNDTGLGIKAGGPTGFDNTATGNDDPDQCDPTSFC